MNNNLTHLHDPRTGRPLAQTEHGLACEDGTIYSVINGIPRFVPVENYAQAFGQQWNLFPQTQLDSYTGLMLSEDRLARCLNGRLASIKGKRVLEVGSGAGRFTEILLKHGAIVDSCDYSSAVEANAKNNGQSGNLTIVQADVRHLPFPPASYDYVVCLGVIQHTPNPEETIEHLWRMVRPGGALVIDHYQWKLRNFLPPPIGVGGLAYRWYFLRLPAERQFRAVKRVFDFWFPIVWRFRESRFLQFLLARFTPIVNYYPRLGLKDRDMYYEWMLLDTHDAMTDVYKHRRTPRSIRRTLVRLGATNISVTIAGNGIEAYCEKPGRPEAVA